MPQEPNSEDAQAVLGHVASTGQLGRWRWLLCWMRQRGCADVLNRDLVWDYIEAHGCRYSLQTIGAPHCKQLSRDLAAMARRGYAKRRTTGIEGGLCDQGFPRWVWSYRPGKRADDLERLNAELTGAAPLYGEASSDRRERG